MPTFSGSPGFPIQGPYVATQVTPTSPARGPLSAGLGKLMASIVNRANKGNLTTLDRYPDSLPPGPPPLWNIAPFRIPRLWHPNVGTYYGGLSNYSTIAQWQDAGLKTGVRLPPPAIPRKQTLKYNAIATTAGNIRIPAVMLPAGL